MSSGLYRELKQGWHRWQWEHHLKIQLRVSALISQLLFPVIVCAKCNLNIMALNCNQHSRDRKTNLNICHHMLMSSKQLQKRSFHVMERTRTSGKCTKMNNAHIKRAKLLFFIVKYANLWHSCCCCCRGCLSSLMICGAAARACLAVCLHLSSRRHICICLLCWWWQQFPSSSIGNEFNTNETEMFQWR